MSYGTIRAHAGAAHRSRRRVGESFHQPAPDALVSPRVWREPSACTFNHTSTSGSKLRVERVAVVVRRELQTFGLCSRNFATSGSVGLKAREAAVPQHL